MEEEGITVGSLLKEFDEQAEKDAALEAAFEEAFSGEALEELRREFRKQEMTTLLSFTTETLDMWLIPQFSGSAPSEITRRKLLTQLGIKIGQEQVATQSS